MLKWVTGILGDSNEKELRQLQPFVEEINKLEPEIEALSDDQLRAKTDEFRSRLASGETLDDLLPEAFAAVREASRRKTGLRHFDVQLTGGVVLHQGKIAEMKTGEGKTLVATLALYLNALAGEGAHLVTVNDYLAKRDAQWMGPIYVALGLTVGILQHDASFRYSTERVSDTENMEHLTECTRREAYQADITYGTNHEFGFDYLRDNMKVDLNRGVHRNLYYAIVDEVDNILIDEARTPLIISGPSPESTQTYSTFARLVPRLQQELDGPVYRRPAHPGQLAAHLFGAEPLLLLAQQGNDLTARTGRIVPWLSMLQRLSGVAPASTPGEPSIHSGSGFTSYPSWRLLESGSQPGGRRGPQRVCRSRYTRVSYQSPERSLDSESSIFSPRQALPLDNEMKLEPRAWREMTRIQISRSRPLWEKDEPCSRCTIVVHRVISRRMDGFWTRYQTAARPVTSRTGKETTAGRAISTKAEMRRSYSGESLTRAVVPLLERRSITVG
ncbi:MAG: hypothetical protein IIB21_01970 [Chloroflexi bacterium]|nr:hypothetical protein [Chloroflexota bacterium]